MYVYLVKGLERKVSSIEERLVNEEGIKYMDGKISIMGLKI